MLECVNVTKDFKVHGGVRRVLKGVNLTVQRGEKVGILGYNGAGKSTLMRIIGGVDVPTSGYVRRDMSLSWPLGFTGAFQGSLSGLDNLRFICRIYGKDYRRTRNYVEDFAQLGSKILEPVKTFSSGMRARLAFALSLIIEFDCYLIDEVIMVGDIRFTEKCKKELFGQKGDKAMVLVSHNMNFVKEVCDKCIFLLEGKMYECPSVEEGIEIYNSVTKEANAQKRALAAGAG